MPPKSKRAAGTKPKSKPAVASPPPVTDVDAITASLIAEFDGVDTSLIFATVNDYQPDVLANLATIREYLGIFQASSVPDDTDFALVADPSISTSTSDLGDLLDRSSISARDYADGPPSPPSSWNVVSKKKGKSRAKAGSSTSTRVSMISTSQKSANGAPPSSGSGRASHSSRSLGESSSPTTASDEAGLEDEMSLLQTLFPNLKQSELRTALADAISVQAAIDQLLSVELIKTVQDTGAWPDEPTETLTDDEGFQPLRRNVSTKSFGSTRSLEAIPMSPSLPSSSQTAKPKVKGKGKQYALMDTLQRVPTPSSHTSSRAQTPAPLSRTYGLSGPAPNAWTTLASLATQLSVLLAPQPESYFTSFLHSPDYRSAHSAVHGALARLPTLSRSSDAFAETIYQDMYGLSLTDEDEARKRRDFQVALRVCGEDVGAAMDLVDLLDEISHWAEDEDVVDRYGGDEDECGIPADLFQTLPTPTAPASQRQGWSRPSDTPERMRRPKKIKIWDEVPKVIPGAQPAASSASFPTAHDDFGSPASSPQTPSSAGSRPQKHAQNWRKVAHPRPPPRERAGNYAMSHVHGDDSGHVSVEDCLKNAALARHRREVAIKAAGQSFTPHMAGGKAKNMMVTSHYASQARTAADSARQWESRAAAMVVHKQLASSGNEIDLHQMDINQAVVASKAAVERWYAAQRAAFANAGQDGLPSSARAMRIITGAGNHSVGGRGVLGPAVARALEDEGWKVERGETSRGWLLIRGRK